MDRNEFDSLPIGSVVSHRSSQHTCTYRKVRGVGFVGGDQDRRVKVGWVVARLNAPWAVQSPGDPFRVDLNDASACTLILRGQEPVQGRKAARISELEAELERAGAKVAEHEATIARLRAVIASARGTLGAGRI